MHKTAGLLVRLGGLFATIGGAGIVAVWAATFEQEDSTFLNARGWAAIAVTVFGAVMIIIGTLLQHRAEPRTQITVQGAAEATGPIAVAGDGGLGGGHFGSGGDGGSATVIGDRGRAYGGRGGRGGLRGGDGGQGGDAAILSGRFIDGTMGGGAGGDAARRARPALGAHSPLFDHQITWPQQIPGTCDKYGMPLPGRGGDSYVTYVDWEGRSYCINVLLRLLDMKDPMILDRVDDVVESSAIDEPNDWWRLAVEMFPEQTEEAMRHMRQSEDRVGPEDAAES